MFTKTWANTSSAIDFYEQASSYFLRNRRPCLGRAMYLSNLGNAYASLGQYERAIDLHEQRPGRSPVRLEIVLGKVMS
jgi:tetratricopeptide (TPR) repeat protein